VEEWDGAHIIWGDTGQNGGTRKGSLNEQVKDLPIIITEQNHWRKLPRKFIEISHLYELLRKAIMGNHSRGCHSGRYFKVTEESN